MEYVITSGAVCALVRLPKIDAYRNFPVGSTVTPFAAAGIVYGDPEIAAKAPVDWLMEYALIPVLET
jgi:hypothetical protein